MPPRLPTPTRIARSGSNVLSAATAILVAGAMAGGASAQTTDSPADTAPGTPPAEPGPPHAAPPPPAAPPAVLPPPASGAGGDDAQIPEGSPPPVSSPPPTATPEPQPPIKPPGDGATSWLPIVLLVGAPLAFGAAAILFIRTHTNRFRQRGLAQD